jgi:flagellar assembly factor FliW
MVKLNTKPYGEIEVHEKQRVHFPDGIIGFEEVKEYYLLDSREGGPFYWMQAADRPELAFVLMNPRIFRDDYRLQVPLQDLKSIGIESEEECVDFVILTIPEDSSMISANLMGPIIINRSTRVARQSISLNDNHTTRHYILEEIKVRAGRLVETG